MLRMKEEANEGGVGENVRRLRHSKDSEFVCASAPELPGIFLASLLFCFQLSAVSSLCAPNQKVKDNSQTRGQRLIPSATN